MTGFFSSGNATDPPMGFETYSTNYLVLCPNCNNGAEIERKKVKEFTELARKNKVSQ